MESLLVKFVPRGILAPSHITRPGKLAVATALLQRRLHRAAAPARDSGTNADREFVTASGQNGEVLAIGSPGPAKIRDRTEKVFPPSRSRGATHSSQAVHEKTSGTFLPLSFSNAAGTRAYKLYIPSSYNSRQPCPLIVMLHGCTQSPDDFAAGTRMNVLADELTFLAAYPEQSLSANLSKCWNWFSRKEQQRDRGEPLLVAGITRRIMQDYAVDRKRVYVAGISAGAAAAAVLGATYPDVYAAIGVHSGIACGLAHNLPSALSVMRTGAGDASAGVPERRPGQNLRPIPTIVFHGDRDTTVNPRNGDRFAAQLATVVSCDKRVETGQVSGGRSFTRTTYVDATDQRVLEQWVVHGEGHAWSGGSPSGSYTDVQGPDASRAIVRFFLSHRLRGEVSA